MSPNQQVEREEQAVPIGGRVSAMRGWHSGRPDARRGMTLVEVMVVIAIVVSLMGILGAGIMSIYNSSRVETTKLQMGRIVERVQIYTVKKKKPPTTSEGLSAVYGDEQVPKDAWGNDFTFVAPGPNGADYDIISYGSDGVEGGTGNAEDIHLADME